MASLDAPGWALALGVGSALSLPIGSAVGLAARPRAVVTSALMAFGAGALLFALTIEIVGHSYHQAGGGFGAFLPIAAGCVAGGVLFEILNQWLNGKGGFLRKVSTLARHVTRTKRGRAEALLASLSRVEILREAAPEEVARLVPHIETVEPAHGEVIFAEGDAGDALYLVDRGALVVERGGRTVAKLRSGEAFGEMALLSHAPRNATVRVAAPGTTLFRIERADFERLLESSETTTARILALAGARAAEAPPAEPWSEEKARAWKERAVERLYDGDLAPTRMEIHREAMSAHATHGARGAALGIWLGILLDAIPESIVIGISLVGVHGAPWGLLAGVFLANFPEALSSSNVMRAQNYAVGRIQGLWWIVVAVTGLGALVGNVVLRGLSPDAFGFIEGCAAGAMLTSIAETMLPEAYEQGGWIVGLATLAGFLAAFFVKAAA